MRNTIETFWSKVDQSAGPDACWPWTGYRHPGGYGRLHINGRPVLAHRLAFHNATGIDPTGLLVCHRCDNPPCCNPAHLFLGTPADNNADKASKGRSTANEAHWNVRLTDAQVIEIRRLHSAGTPRRSLAQTYGVSKTQITRIVNGQQRRLASTP